MKVKIGTTIYDAETTPIMIILSKADKRNIGAMEPSATRYCSYPDFMDPKYIKKWMKLP